MTKLSIVFLLFLSGVSLSSQNNNIQSNIRIYDSEYFHLLAKEIQSQNVDSAIQSIRYGLEIAKNSDYYILGELQYMLSKIFYFKKTNYDSAMKYARLAGNNLLISDSISKALDANKIEAYALSSHGEYDKAIKIHQDIYFKSDTLQLNVRKAIALNNIGEVYRSQENKEKALEYLVKAKNLIDNYTDYRAKFTIYHNLALAYDINGNTNESIELLLSMLTEKRRMNESQVALIYHNLGRLYILVQQFNVAESYLDSAMQYPSWRSSKKRLTASYKEMVTLYNYTNRSEKALPIALKLYSLSYDIKNLTDIEDATRNLSETYEGLHRYKEALNYSKELVKVKSKMFDKETNQLIAEMDAKYQTYEKENEIIRLDGERVLAEKRKKTFLLVIFLLSIISMLVILILRLRLQKKNVIVQLKQSEIDIKTKALELKQQQLRSFTKLIKEKNRMLEKAEGQKDLEIENIERLAKSIILTEEDWLSFKDIFEQVHENFFLKLRCNYPEFSENDIRISALMKLNLSNKEISNMLGISNTSVIKAKYRLKKKLGLNEKVELNSFVEAL